MRTRQCSEAEWGWWTRKELLERGWASWLVLCRGNISSVQESSPRSNILPGMLNLKRSVLGCGSPSFHSHYRYVRTALILSSFASSTDWSPVCLRSLATYLGMRWRRWIWEQPQVMHLWIWSVNNIPGGGVLHTTQSSRVSSGDWLSGVDLSCRRGVISSQ